MSSSGKRSACGGPPGETSARPPRARPSANRSTRRRRRRRRSPPRTRAASGARRDSGTARRAPRRERGGFQTTRPAGTRTPTEARPRRRQVRDEVFTYGSVTETGTRRSEPFGAPNRLGSAHVPFFARLRVPDDVLAAVAYNEPSCENAPAVSGGGGRPVRDARAAPPAGALAAARRRRRDPHLRSPSADVVHAIARYRLSSAEPRTETELTAFACASHTHTHVPNSGVCRRERARARRSRRRDEAPRPAHLVANEASSRVQIRSVSSGARSASASIVPVVGSSPNSSLASGARCAGRR